jgi:hypothetical protein
MADPLVQMGNNAVTALTPDQQALSNNQNITAGQAGSPWSLPSVPPVAASQTIPVAQVVNTPSLNLPQPDLSLNQADAAMAGATQAGKSIQDYMKELTPPTTDLGNSQSALISKLQELYGSNVGKAKDTAALEQSSGVNDLRKQFADLNSQILTKNAEYVKLRDTVEKSSNLKGSFSSKDVQLARSQAADVGLLQARALGMQGQVQAAQDAVSRAIDLKYAGIEEEITAREKQLQVIQPLLDKEEKRLATAQQLKIEDDRQRVAEEKAKSKENINLAFQANVQTKFGNKNGEFFRTSDGKTYGSAKEFFDDAGVKSFDDAYRQGLITDISAQSVADIGFVQQLRAAYPDAGINFNDDAQTAVDKLGQSNKYVKENSIDSGDDGFTLSPGQNRYDSAGNLIASGGQANDKPLTEAQAKDVTYAQRSEESNVYLNNLESSIAKYNPVGFSAQLKLEANNTTNGVASDQIKQLRQAERNFGTAVLRRESGAAISPSEFATMEKQYFPRPGDDAQTLAQKAQNRLTAINSFKASNPNKNGSTSGTWQYQDPSTGDIYQFPSQQSYDQFRQDNGIPFNSAGNASDSNQVKGMRQTLEKLPLLNMDGSTKTPNLPLTKAYPAGSKGGQCGIFVRNIVNKMGLDYPRVGDSLAEKMAAVRKYGSKKGGIGSVVITSENKKNGHVAYIIGKNDKGYILAESNYGLNGKVNYGRTIPFNSPSIIGFIKPS